LVEIICKNYLLYTLMVVFVLGVLSRLILVAAYNSLRRSTYNMGNPDNKLLKQIKLKYESYDKLNMPVTNAAAFTKKAMCEYRVCGMSLRFLEKFLGQALFWCIAIGLVAVGCGYFFSISTEILVLYGVSAALFCVLLYNIDKVSDIEYSREVIEVYIVDYLENRMHERLMEEEAVLPQEILPESGVLADIEEEAIKEAVKMSDDRCREDDENKIIEDVLNEIFC